MCKADMHEELLLHLGVSHAIVLSHDYGDTVLQELLARKHDKYAISITCVTVTLTQSLCT